MSQRTSLSLKNVSHVFKDVPAVYNFSINIAPNEVVCLLGPSGCGKTTVLRLAAGLESVQKGEIWINDILVANAMDVDLATERRDVGLVFQDYALFPHLSVLQNVEFGLGHTLSDKRLKVMAALERVNMSWALERYPHTLSGGQQQRVALARALAPEPKVILLDEPFSGLDSRLRDQIRDKSLHVLKESGAAVLMVTHDAEEAMFMADRIAVMRDGCIVQCDKPDVLYLEPVSAFVAEFFGETNKLYGEAKDHMISTPIGYFPAPGILDGGKAEIVIRPEAIKIKTKISGAELKGRVVTARMLGRSSLIHLCVCENVAEEIHLHSYVTGHFLPDENEIVSVNIDPAHVFIFPLGSED